MKQTSELHLVTQSELDFYPGGTAGKIINDTPAIVVGVCP